MCYSAILDDASNDKCLNYQKKLVHSQHLGISVCAEGVENVTHRQLYNSDTMSQVSSRHILKFRDVHG